MATLHSCPRCQATIRAGQLVCARCGLHLDDKRLGLETDQRVLSRQLLVPTQPIMRRKSVVLAGLIAGIVLVGLSVAGGMAQTQLGEQSGHNNLVPIPTQTLAPTRVIIATALAPLSSATPLALPPTSVVQAMVEFTPIQIPTVTSRPPLPPTTEPTHAPTYASTPVQPPQPTAKPKLTATSTIARKLTPTRIPAPSATRLPPSPTVKVLKPSPTSAPQVPHNVGTTKDLNGWTVSVTRVEPRKELIVSTNPEVKYVPGGNFWMVYVDARNNGSSARSLGQSVDFSLTDNKGTVYLERSDRGKDKDVREFARVLGRDYLDMAIPPGRTARTLLVFVMSTDSQPKVLTAQPIGPDGKISNAGKVRFDVPQK